MSPVHFLPSAAAEIAIRDYAPADFDAVAALWERCGLTRPWNDPADDIALCLDSGHGAVLVGEAPAGEARMRVAFAYPAQFLRELPVLQKLLETDSDYILRAIRQNYDAIRDTVAELLGPMLADNDLVRRGAMSVDQSTDWMVRVMVSLLLFPAQDPEALAGGLAATHRALHGLAE